jgi:hypothetical protein
VNTRCRILLAGAAALALLGAACAKPPTAQIEARKRQLQQIVQKEDAERYAPGAARAARDSIAALDDLVAAESGRFVLLRKYGRVTARLGGVDAALADLRREAQLGKETMRTEVSGLLEQTESALDSAAAEYQGAPAIKGGGTMQGLIRGEMTAIQTLVAQARESAAADQVAAAHEQATTALGRARRLLDEVRASKAKVRALRARRAG